MTVCGCNIAEGKYNAAADEKSGVMAFWSRCHDSTPDEKRKGVWQEKGGHSEPIHMIGM